jgi:ribosomal protein S21
MYAQSQNYFKKNILRAGIPKDIKQNNLPQVRSKSKLINKHILRAGIPKGINRITFLMYTQSKLINKNILRAGILKGINRITFLMYTHSQNYLKKNILRAGILKGIKQNNLPHVHSVKTNKQKYFESRNTKGYKQ